MRHSTAMDTKQACFLLGGVLVGIGLLFGLLPVKAIGNDCGSAFAKDDYAPAICDEPVNERGTVAIALGLPGLVLLGVGYSIVYREQTLAAEADMGPSDTPSI